MKHLTFALLALLVFGCSTVVSPHRTLPERIQTVYIPMPRNESFEYGFEEMLARELHQEFLADGRVQVVGRHQADSVLNTTITDFRRIVASTNADGYPHTDEAIITATVSLTEPGRDEPTVNLDGLTSTRMFISDTRRSQFSPEPEWRQDLLRGLAQEIVFTVLTHQPEASDTTAAPSTDNVSVDLDLDDLGTRPSVSPSYVQY